MDVLAPGCERQRSEETAEVHSNASAFLNTGIVSYGSITTNVSTGDHAVIAFARDDDYFFGVLHSRDTRGVGKGEGNSARIPASLHSDVHVRDLSLSQSNS